MAIVKTFGPGPIDLTPANLNNMQTDAEDVINRKHLLFSFTSGPTDSARDVFLGTWSTASIGITGGVGAKVVDLNGMTQYFYYDPAEWRTNIVGRLPRLSLKARLLKGSTSTGITSVLTIAKLNEPVVLGSTSLSRVGVTDVSSSLTFTLGTDANLLERVALDIDTSAWVAGLYGVRQVNTGSFSGLGWAIIGQVLASAS